MTESRDVDELLKTLLQQQTAFLQVHAESVRLQHALIARVLEAITLSSLPSSPVVDSRSVETVSEAPRTVEDEPAPTGGSRDTTERVDPVEPPVLRVVGGTASRATRYYQERPRTSTSLVTRQQIDALKQVQDTGPAGRTVLQFGQYKGQTLGAIALADPDYVRWLSLKAQRPQVREAARQVLASLSSRLQALSARASTVR